MAQVISNVLFIPPDLQLIPPSLRHMACEALAARDVVGFLCRADNEHGLALVARNLSLLESLGIYESALVEAFMGCRTNLYRYPPSILHRLFARANLSKLRAAGSPLPGHGPYTLYRGVAGHARARRIYGLSWTLERTIAQWFADRAASWGLADPAVYEITVPKRAVLVYIEEREEREMLVWVPRNVRAQRIA
jgi:hypothetical protein